MSELIEQIAAELVSKWSNTLHAGGFTYRHTHPDGVALKDKIADALRHQRDLGRAEANDQIAEANQRGDYLKLDGVMNYCERLKQQLAEAQQQIKALTDERDMWQRIATIGSPLPSTPHS